jgi:hypothetical protein
MERLIRSIPWPLACIAVGTSIQRRCKRPACRNLSGFLPRMCLAIDQPSAR